MGKGGKGPEAIPTVHNNFSPSAQVNATVLVLPKHGAEFPREPFKSIMSMNVGRRSGLGRLSVL